MCIFACNLHSVTHYQGSVLYIPVFVGGWPLLNISAQTTWSLNGDQFIQEKLLNSPAFFTLDISVSPTDRTKHIIYVCIFCVACCDVCVKHIPCFYVIHRCITQD